MAPRFARLWLALVASALAACGEAAPGALDLAQIDQVLNRIGYGPDVFTVQRIQGLGVDGYIEEQLHPEAISDAETDALLASYPSLGLSLNELESAYGGEGGEAWRPLEELKTAKLLRAVTSHRQLEAVLVDFWFDHFNVYAPEGTPLLSTTVYERDAIRPHVLGRFVDLLRATARSPAMLDYLDNGYSEADGLNLNYAREVLELHTLGVDGGYLQADVIAVARCLTGWTFSWDWQTERYETEDGFRFDAGMHDRNAKSFMGALALPAGGGIGDGEALLAFLADHPATALRVSRLLVRRFVDENAPEDLVIEAANTWLATDGDLREVMRTILHSPEFLNASHRRTKVKRPLVYLASILRASRANPRTSVERAVGDLDDLGEPLFEARPPTGFPDSSGFWINAGAALHRFNLATSFAADSTGRGARWGISSGTSAEVVDWLAYRLLLGHVSPGTRDAAVAHLVSLPASASQTTRVEEAAAILMSSPEFLQH